MIVRKVVHNLARERCIPIDSVKSRDDYLNFVHTLEIGAYIDSDKTNPAYLLVKVMLC